MNVIVELQIKFSKLKLFAVYVLNVIERLSHKASLKIINSSVKVISSENKESTPTS